MQLTVESVIGLLGLILAVIAIVLVLVFRRIEEEKRLVIIEERLKRFEDRAERIVESTQGILREVQGVTSAHYARPELMTYLANQWEFIEKTFHNRFEKHDICRRIVHSRISDNSSVLLDSGSSVDLVTYELLGSRKENITVFTNNVFAAMHLVGTKEVNLKILAGEFNDRFAAVYDPESNSRIRGLGINVFILAATAIRFSKGIMVHVGDRDNSDFKAAVLNAFARSERSHLVVAVDATKFLEPTERHQGVLSEQEWSDMVAEHGGRVAVVTSQVRPEVAPEDRVAFEQELERFRRAGVHIDIPPQHERRGRVRRA
jgi:DeoR/GlpR family transcriptional regulator of sugar metabolism